MKHTNKILSLALMAFALRAYEPAHAAPIGKTEFEKVIYLNAAMTSTQSAAYSGVDYTNAKGFYDGDLWAIPADTVIEQMFVVVDTAVSGITLFELGDDDDANDFIASSSSPFVVGAATTGLMYFDTLYKGNYLKAAAPITAGIQIAKYYSAAGKELKLNVTGTATTGKVRLVLRGFHL